MNVIWGRGSSFNLGRLEGTEFRIERSNLGTKEKPEWQMLLSDKQETYLHVDDRTFTTKEELEEAAIQWLVDSGRLAWLH